MKCLISSHITEERYINNLKYFFLFFDKTLSHYAVLLCRKEAEVVQERNGLNLCWTLNWFYFNQWASSLHQDSRKEEVHHAQFICWTCILLKTAMFIVHCCQQFWQMYQLINRHWKLKFIDITTLCSLSACNLVKNSKFLILFFQDIRFISNFYKGCITKVPKNYTFCRLML